MTGLIDSLLSGLRELDYLITRFSDPSILDHLPLERLPDSGRLFSEADRQELRESVGTIEKAVTESRAVRFADEPLTFHKQGFDVLYRVLKDLQEALSTWHGMSGLDVPKYFRELATEVDCKALIAGIESVRKLTPATPDNGSGQADKKADNGKKILPDNPDVSDLCRELKKGIAKGGTQIEIARTFTRGDNKKAVNLLRQARRFRPLWS